MPSTVNITSGSDATLQFAFRDSEGAAIALTLKCDKAADVVGGFFGWTETE